MKMINGILGCALAAGLMTFAADNVQASGIVIGNDLYTPVSLKLVVTSKQDNGKFKKMSVTSKTVLTKLGYKGATLAYFMGDVYVITTKTKTIVTDLTEDGIMTADFNDLLDNEVDNSNGSSKYTETGILTIQLDSDGNLNSVESEQQTTSFDGFYSFDISGLYSLKESESAFDKNDNYSEKISVKASNMSGSGVDTDLSLDDLPVSGSVKASGSGKLSD